MSEKEDIDILEEANSQVFACPECSRQFMSVIDVHEHYNINHQTESEIE